MSTPNFQISFNTTHLDAAYAAAARERAGAEAAAEWEATELEGWPE
jgi:hypothetical protein